MNFNKICSTQFSCLSREEMIRSENGAKKKKHFQFAQSVKEAEEKVISKCNIEIRWRREEKKLALTAFTTSSAQIENN